MTAEPIPGPGRRSSVGDADSAWWWDALAEGRLLLPCCSDCGHTFFPPLAWCPECGSTSVERVPSAGTGRVYSWVVVHQPFRPEEAGLVPFTIVAVDLDEGGRVFGRARPGVTLMAGAPVTAVIDQDAAGPMLSFGPA